MLQALIGISALVYLLDGLIHSLLGPLAPEIAAELQLSNAQLGPIFSANLVGQCIGLVALPPLASRVGQRAVVLASLVGFGLAQAATALADGPNSLFAWRLVTGIFLGGALPSCLALVTAAAPAARRGVAITLLFTGYGTGATLAGIVATAFESYGGWRMAMVAAGVACLLTAVLGLVYLREPPDSEAPQPAPETGRARLGVLQILGPNMLLGTLMLWLLFIAMLTVSYCLVSWLPTLLVEVGRDRSFAALSISIFSFGGIVASLAVGLLIDRWGATRVLVSFLCIAAVMLLATGWVLESASGATLMSLLAIGGFFFLGAYGGVNVILATYYPPQLRATGIGWAKSVGRIGTVIAPVLIGAALGVGIPGTVIMSLFAVPAAVAMVTLLVIAFSRRSVVLSEAVR